MYHRLPLALFCCSLGLVGPGGAVAAPLPIPAAAAAAPPRTDSGTGVCATAVHVTPAIGLLSPFLTFEQAVVYLNLGKGMGVVGMGTVDDKVTTSFKLFNLRNADPTATGDFTGGGTEEALFPFSNDNGAIPRGNDQNFAVRLRGYLNITLPEVRTLVVFADDAARLLIGGTQVLEAKVGVSARVGRQVQFAAAGLYPLELIFYQNGSPAILEVSQRSGAFTEGNLTMLEAGFALVPTAQLFTAAAGSGACGECTIDASCAAGSFCGDGLCQPCVTALHCGAACAACPAGRPLCAVGACVQCIDDSTCPAGQTCDGARGTCVAPMAGPCTASSECPSGQICDLVKKQCAAPVPCLLDAQCPAGQSCDVGKGTCVAPPGPAPGCTQDFQCTAGQSCDPATQACVAAPRCTQDSQCAGAVCDTQAGACTQRPAIGQYAGGCSATRGGSQPGPPFALGLCLLGLWRRGRRGFFFVTARGACGPS